MSMMSEAELLNSSHGIPDSDSEVEKPVKNPMSKGWNRYAAEGYTFVNNNPPGSPKRVQFADDGSESTPYKSKTEKQLCALLALSLLLITSLLIALMVISLAPQESPTSTCMSPDCVMVAGGMLKKMDLSSDPCDDFYVYACNAEIHDPLIPPSAKKWSVFQQVSKKNMAIVKKLLDEPGSEYKGVNSTAVHKAKLIFDSCMNISAKETVSNDRLLQIIADVGSWPLTSDAISGTWDVTTWSIETTLSRLFHYQTSALFSFSVSTDDKDSNVQRIVIDQGGTMYSNPEYYKNNETTLYEDAYIKFFVKITTLLGADSAAATQSAKDIWQLEQALAKAFDSPESRIDPHNYYDLMTVSELQGVLGSDLVNFHKYLGLIFNKTIPMSEEVLVYGIKYIKKMGVIANTADEMTLSTYMVWHVVASMVPYMPLPYRLALQELETSLTGVMGQGELWEDCVGRTQGIMGFVTGALFAEQHFFPEDKAAVESILSEIRGEFIRNLPSVSWMDDVTRQKAITKAEGILEKIGYPPFIMDPLQLDQYYANLQVQNNSDFDNALGSRSFSAWYILEKYGKPTDKSVWSMSPDEVNAYYSPSSNQIVFPAGILQNPFYDRTYPRSLLFGGIGMVMGHELSHGFDNQGRLFDLNGNLKNWWTNESAQNFLDKTSCFVDEYSHFIVEGEHLNGKTTLGENIADNAGLKTTYNAYKSWSEKTGYIERPLPGLNTTDEQLFFLGFSQLWCSYYTPAYAKTAIVTDPHSYAKYRVLGTLQNRPEFSDAYQCRVNSPMNPPNKCTMW